MKTPSPGYVFVSNAAPDPGLADRVERANAAVGISVFLRPGPLLPEEMPEDEREMVLSGEDPYSPLPGDFSLWKPQEADLTDWWLEYDKDDPLGKILRRVA